MLAIPLILSVTVDSVPARAQDIFGFFKLFSSPSAPTPAPAYQPNENSPDGARARPRAKARSHPQPVEETAVPKPLKPRTPGEMDNPVPALMADSTLRPGDMVMFPDGLRVFTGQPGGQHKLADFKLLSKAGNAVPRATRKLVANLAPSENPSWSTRGLKSGSQLAANTKDVETTGSIKQSGGRRSQRD